MKTFFREPIVKFLALGLILYLGWLALYEWWIHPLGWVDTAVIDNTLFISQKVLGWMGYATEMRGDRVMRIAGTPGLFIGDSCNGISLFALYSIFIIAFPGKIISKIIFIPAGILIIHLLNVLRVILLAIIETYSYEWTEFNHSYTFTIIIYACIFGMWLFWINKFSGMKKNK
ncbi:MAG: archaeosortase/exosortase family protein [Bacteroidetes bacterium]|nr:archaeosortase/exosortase family protein [Bacteroidota bacterium]